MKSYNKTMKKITLSITLQLFLISMAIGQVFVPSEEKKYQSLIDEVHVFTLFVDTQMEYWEEGEMDYFYGELLKSQQWLQEQAENYQQFVEFNNDFFFRNKEVIYIENISLQNSKNVLKKAMEELRFEDFDAFLDANNFDFEKKKLKLIFFVKDANRSHAFNYWSSSDIDIAIIYCRRTNGMWTDQYVISHEMLHQFGAWDLYYGESQSYEKAEKAKELYPNSIMISTYFNKWALEVDELTAWRIGWHNNTKEEYQTFVPVRTKTRPKRPARTGDGGIKFDFGKKKDKEKDDKNGNRY